MPSGADTTKRNWQASRRLTVLLFTRLRRENPEWDFEDLVRHLDLPPSRLFLELAEEAGFEVGGEPSTAEQNKILKVMLREVFGAKEIARETGLPLAKVERYLREVGVPFGAGGYGMFPWPGKLGDTDEDPPAPVAEPRRVSARGQFSYKGHTYGVGQIHASRTCWVEEAGNRLIVHFSGRPSLMLCK